MSNYERWVLYPLLLFSLVLSLKSLVGGEEAKFSFVSCDHLVCKQLTVQSVEENRRLVHLGQNPTARTAEITLYGEAVEPLIRLGLEPEGKQGVVEAQRLRAMDETRQRRSVEIGSGAGGIGEITLFGNDDSKPAVTLGAAEQGSVIKAVRGNAVDEWPGR